MTLTTLFLLALGLLVVGYLVNRALVSSRAEAKDTRPPYVVALGALADGDEETAFRELRNAVRLDSANADAYLRLGELIRRRGDAVRAHQLHRELATRTTLPRELMARVQRALARDLLALGKVDKAGIAAEEAVRLDESLAGTLETLLEIRERLGDLEGAYKVKKELVKRVRRGKTPAGAADLATYRASQAWTLLDQGDAKGAERLVKDAQRMDESNRWTRYVAGLVQEQAGNYGDAIETWGSLLRDRPDEAALVFHALERVHFLDGSFSRMEQTYESFLRKFPDHPDASFGLARFLRRKGQLDDALDVCRRGLDAHPESRELRALTLVLLLQSGRSAEAEGEIDAWISRLVGERDTRTPPAAGPLGERTLAGGGR